MTDLEKRIYESYDEFDLLAAWGLLQKYILLARSVGEDLTELKEIESFLNNLMERPKVRRGNF